MTHTKSKQFAQKKSLSFIENKGQIRDQYGNARNDIDFKLSAGEGLNVFVGRGGLHYQWSNNIKSQIPNSKSQKLKEDALGNRPRAYDSALATEMYRMDVELLNANPNTEIIKEEKQNYYETYYTAPFNPDKGGTIHSYTKITYKNIYRNIDWVLYVRDERIEYDFIIHPRGNAKDIQLKYGGATNLALDDNGGMIAATSFGKISEKSPYTFEKESHKIIPSSFILKNNILSFDIAEYKGTLIIDPALEWATYFGGTSHDAGVTVANDSSGNAYLMGETNSTANIATIGAYQTTFAGGTNDAFLAKFRSGGALLWATYFGGSGVEDVSGGTCDRAGNAYITGLTTSTSNIASTGAYQTTFGGVMDAYLVKFNSSGVLQWSTYFGGSQQDEGEGVVCDTLGNIFICGDAESTNNIATAGAYQTTMGGIIDAFLAKFNSSGALQWATYFGGAGNDLTEDINCDNLGNVYLGGETNSISHIATPGAYQTVLNGGRDAFLAKFSSAGALIWATYYGGISDEIGTFVTCDERVNVYLSGYTSSTGNIATSGAYQVSYGGGTSDAFLAKFNSAGNMQWATYFGGTGSDYGWRLCNDQSEHVYLIGSTDSSTNLATPNASQTTFSGNSSPFIAKFNANGTIFWSTYFGNGAGIGGISCDLDKNIFLTGATVSNGITPTSAAYQTVYGGGVSDAYLAKLGADTFMIAQPYPDSVLCVGDTFNLLCYMNINYLSPNIFTVQLSDSSGSFINPINVGSVTNIYTSSIFCTIPLNAIPGIHYRIRVISSHPVDTSYEGGINIALHNAFAASVSISSSPAIPVAGHIDTFTASCNCNGAASYQWYNKGLAIPGATTSSYTCTINIGDSISVVMHCSLSCANPDSARSNIIGASMGVGNLQLTTIDANVYPNPFDNSLTLSFSKGERTLEVFPVVVKVFDLVGKEVYGSVMNANKMIINTNSFAPGTYILEIHGADGSRVMKKIVK